MMLPSAGLLTRMWMGRGTLKSPVEAAPPVRGKRAKDCRATSDRHLESQVSGRAGTVHVCTWMRWVCRYLRGGESAPKSDALARYRRWRSRRAHVSGTLGLPPGICMYIHGSLHMRAKVCT